MGFWDKGELCREVDWACFKDGFVRISWVFVREQEILGLDGPYIIRDNASFRTRWAPEKLW